MPARISRYENSIIIFKNSRMGVRYNLQIFYPAGN
jgi:hypothetical protein